MSAPRNGGSNRRVQGFAVEEAACKLLVGEGLRLITRNFSTHHGEIDLIMEDRSGRKRTLVFIEVRYRRSNRYGGAAGSVSATKRARIRATATTFIRQHSVYRAHPARFDVIAATGPSDDLQLIWLQSAFE